ncbi:bZIP transcription factor 17 [Senna tora]|uniref:BZIP transcription factor 17 n=1 Tax=Senna tora TaxID=362788 RepID=A0A834WH38_9FABA|nr:bZIP transcription factor 17 [Senna tora]
MLRPDLARESGSLRRNLLFLLLFTLVSFWRFSVETLATDDAGTIAPGFGEASNWKTSVHKPELNMGPASTNWSLQNSQRRIPIIRNRQSSFSAILLCMSSLRRHSFLSGQDRMDYQVPINLHKLIIPWDIQRSNKRLMLTSIAPINIFI